jgi:PhnB protein
MRLGYKMDTAFEEGFMTGKMKRSVNPVPDGYHTVTPYLTVPGLAKTIEFLKQAFGAETRGIMERPGGGIAHAEVKIGDSIIMMGEPDPKGPYPPMPCNLYMYVPDVDAVYAKAIQAGGKSLRQPTDEFYGDRSSGVEDPSGNFWWIGTHVEDVSMEELKKRMAAMGGQH